MTQPLTITFTLQQVDNILERGGMLSDAQKATSAFLESMKTHKPTVATAEGAPAKKERKARTRHPVAEVANGQRAPQDLAPDGVE